ncbi:TetR family transcriptional regulator [Paenibacillus taihuensis]|uniref:TetR family transcriptional regulator n=1 Tax=Paenibacillus taihuensis TaxID=1156355 RepID=A0A3D9RPW0_9BACL|nr:TetR/AcrR family transcriptional regulator [Paenibacillus taihuensis]REE77724.1 TetR family transcriptional regulator [Paenibacillus taihuensis]
MAINRSSFQTIMDAAEVLIQQKECTQTTLRDIIRQSGMSKGAIYHYVSSKDELFGLLLKSRVEQINTRFTEIVASPSTSGLSYPLQFIAEGMIRSTSHEDVTNKIFIYLLSQMDNDKVEAIVRDIYGHTLETCTSWIEVGKMHKVIPIGTDGSKIAEMLVMFMYGLRVQNTVLQEQRRIMVQDLIAFMSKALS